MSDAVVAKKATPKKTSTKKRASTGPKKVASHPTYQAMIRQALIHLKDKKGSSKKAILVYILANYKVGSNVTQVNNRVRLALNRGVKASRFTQAKGTGASGSFKLAEKVKKVAPKKKTPKKKTAAKKVAKPKKVKTPKKKASPKKAKASPKKAKTPKKVKTPKKAKSPKKPKTKTPKKK